MENLKTLVKASIRNIDIHLVQISDKKYQATWCVKHRELDTLLKADIKHSEITQDIPLVCRPVALSTAMRRFKKLVRAAQDPRITFES